MHVTLEDLYKGKTTKLALTRNVICVTCSGKGGKEGAVRQCPSCSGRGVRVTLRQMGPMIQQIQQPCDECSGTGEIINHKDKCKTCNGRKVVSEKKMLEVHIDKGMRGGQTINFRGESDQAPGVTPGDVIIVIEEKPHERFTRENNDLITTVKVPLVDALTGSGTKQVVEHLDGRKLQVAPPAGIVKPGQKTTIPGEGMPVRKAGAVKQKGDMIVKWEVVFPDRLTPAQKEGVRKVLG